MKTLTAPTSATIERVEAAMNLYQIAGLTVELECSGEILLKRGKTYRMDAGGPADITIDTNDARLKKAREKYPHLSLDEWGYIQTGLAFSRAILDFDGFCLHAAAVGLDHRAVLFSAPCGTGKSTHARLWQEYFGRDKAVIINDDKPALRLINETFHVYGTPWSGKSSLNANIKVPLQAIVFIEQAKKNQIRRLNSKEAVQLLIYQSLRPNSDRDK